MRCKQRLFVYSIVFLFLTMLVLTKLSSSSYPGNKTYKANTRWRPNPTWKNGLNTTYTLGSDFSLQHISYPSLALQLKKDDTEYWVNTTSGADAQVTVNRWFETAEPEVELSYTTTGSGNSRLHVGSKGQPTSVTGVSSWTWSDPYVDYTTLSPDTVRISWAAAQSYTYTFYGLYNETTGLRIDQNVTVTAYFVGAENASESFVLNGTHVYSPNHQPRYFHFELGANDRQYWVGNTEYTSTIYVFTDDTTAYTIVFLDLAGALDDYPFVYCQYYVNGTLRTVEKRKVDVEKKVQMSLVNGRKYFLKIIDGSSYTFGELLMTSTTTIQLTLKGIEFPKDTLLTYKYVRIYGERAFGLPNGNITLTYQDTLNLTTKVEIKINYRNGTNAYSADETSDSFSHVWASASNNTDYAVVCTINHERYGIQDWKQYFPRQFSEAPWGLDFLGTSLPFLTSVIIPSLLIIFVAGCFTRINAETGAVMAVVAAMILTYLGYIAIAPGILITAFCLALLMALIYSKRRVVT